VKQAAEHQHDRAKISTFAVFKYNPRAIRAYRHDKNALPASQYKNVYVTQITAAACNNWAGVGNSFFVTDSFGA
jgi:hypothetical protein